MIRPFQIDVPQEELDDLRRRIAAMRWPERETVADESQGVRLATMQELARYWATDYDWRQVEARLHAAAAVHHRDRRRGHPLHPRPLEARRTRCRSSSRTGGPGSIIEQLKIIGPLTDPTAHGARRGGRLRRRHPVAARATGSRASRPRPAGIRSASRARGSMLMERLGYDALRGAGRRLGERGHGADGAAARRWDCSASTPTCRPRSRTTSRRRSSSATRRPRDLSDEERYAWDQLDSFYKHGLGYAQEMANRPQTLYALEDSPVGLAAWMLDHDARSLSLIARVFDGQAEGLTKDDILDNVTLYWLTNTAVSSARLYWESKLAFFAPKGVDLPTAVSVFPDEIYAAPRSWAERAYPN